MKLLWITSDGRMFPPEPLLKAMGARATVRRAAICQVLADLRGGASVAAAYDLIGVALDVDEPLVVQGVRELLARVPEGRGVVLGARAALDRLPEVPEGWIAVGTDASAAERESVFRLAVAHCAAVATALAGTFRGGAVLENEGVGAAETAGPEPRPAGAHRGLELCGEAAQALLRETAPQQACLRFLVLLQERLGVARLALFLCPSATPWDRLGGPQSSEDDARLLIRASLGIGERECSHLHLSLRGGLGRMVSTEARTVVESDLARCSDRSVARVAAQEFALLGMQVAVPLFDSRRCRGVLMLSRRVAGEGFTSHELLALFQLGRQLATALERFDLLSQASAQQALLEGVMADVDSGVVVVADQMQVVLCNRAAARLMGLGDPALALGRDVAFLAPPVARLAYAAARAPAGSVGAGRLEEEIGGHPVTIQATQFRPPPVEARGELAWVIVVLEDAAAERARRRALAEAERERFVRQLADRLSHELRNALVPMRTFLQLLPERFGEEEFRTSFSRVVTGEVARIESLLDRLTLLTAPVPEKTCAVSLRRAVQAALTQECAGAGAGGYGEDSVAGCEAPCVLMSERRKSIRIEQDWPVEADEVTGTLPPLVSAFRELIRNAVQAMPEGGVLRVGCRCVEEGGQPLLRVEFGDTGPGFPAGVDPTLPFYTTRSVGPGLGLPLAKKVIEGLRGRLVLSAPGEVGARVLVELPARSVRS